MRPWLLVTVATLCAGAGSGCIGEVCSDYLASEATWAPAAIVSNGDRVVVAVAGNAPELRFVAAGADGTLREAGTMSVERHHVMSGTSGQRSAVWAREDTTVAFCSRVLGPYDLILTTDAGDPPRTLRIADSAGATAVSFDGVAYQAFWVTEARELRHRSLGEDGALGPVHALTQLDAPVCLAPTSDAAGGPTALVLVTQGTGGGAWVLLVDPEAGTTTRLWDAPPGASCLDPRTVFWLGGELHLKACTSPDVPSPIVHVLDPATGAARTEAWPIELATVWWIQPNGAGLIARHNHDILELAPDYSVQRRLGNTPASALELLALLGPDVAYAETVALDGAARRPAHVDLVRAADDGAIRWRMPLATDSELIEREVCRPAGF